MTVVGAAAEALASSCTSSPDCISLGYKYTLSDCPNGGVKCPFDTSKYFCFTPESACTYTFTADYCSSQCKNAGTTSCKKNGTTYYASCGSSKCSYGQNCNNGTCVTPAPSCTYQYTTQSCASECKYTGYNSCVRNGTTYYQSCGTSYCLGNEVCEYGICKTPIVNCTYQYTEDNCRKQCKSIDSNSKYCLRNGIIYYETCGASKCSSGQTCENGTCNFQCIYQYTASDCANLCKNIGSKSCIRNGTTYYESCGSSKCSSGQTCENGTCHSPAPKEGYCCGASECGYRGGTLHSYDSSCRSNYGMSCYDYCMQRFGVTCNNMQASCRAQGRTPRFQYCSYGASAGYYYADFTCE